MMAGKKQKLPLNGPAPREQQHGSAQKQDWQQTEAVRGYFHFSHPKFKRKERRWSNTSPSVAHYKEMSLADVTGGHTVYIKMKTVEAIIEPGGGVRLVEPVQVQSPRRALVTILDEEPILHETALLSETALAEDWNRPEEDAAWSHLQPGK
jgi:hypothetical protein